MTKEQIELIIKQEEENIKIFKEKQTQFQELITESERNITKMQCIKPESENPYERLVEDEKYTTIENIEGRFVISTFREEGVEFDENAFKNGLYFNDETFAEKTTKEIDLYLKLKKFTYDNGWSDEVWEDITKNKYYIYKSINEGLKIGFNCTVKRPLEIRFVSEEIAEQAIKQFKDLLDEIS